MSLPVDQQLLIEQRISNETKSTFLAYLLWLVFGMAGIHRLYLGSKLGYVQLAFALLALIGVVSGTPGLALGLAVNVMAFVVDMFMIPALVRDDKARMRKRLTYRAIVSGSI